MNRYKKETFSLSGDGGKVIFKEETVAEIKEWEISIYRDFTEVGSLGNEYTTVVPGLRSWEGSAYIKWNKELIYLELLLELNSSMVQLELSNSRKGTSYKVEAKLDSTSGIPDETEVNIKGTGEFPLDPSLFKSL